MEVNIDTSGLEKLRENMDRLEQDVEVPLLELFSSGFMEAYTTFPDFMSFLEASGLHEGDELTEESFEEIPADEWDRWVEKNTAFESWDEMISQAGVEWMQRELFKGL